MSVEKPCQFEIVLPLRRSKAFELVIDHPALWWITPFSESSGEGHECVIEPHPGGGCYEVGADGQRQLWGTILSIEDPLYVRLAWQVSPLGQSIADPGAASRVMLTFREAGDATRLELVHSDFLRHGEGAETYRDEVAASGTWPRMLEQMKRAAAGKQFS